MGSTGTRSSGTSNTFMSGGSGVTAPNTNQGPLQPNVTITPANQGNPNVQNQVPNSQNVPVTPGALTNISSMSDDELAALVLASKKAQMPNHLADYPSATQKFVFQAGLNEKPAVLDSQAFNQFLSDNNIPQGQVMSRSVNPISYTNQSGYTTKLSGQQINDMLKYSRLNYIGGKIGGKAYGEGAYFAMNGGGGTSYGSTSMDAVLNPKTAKIISDYNLARQASTFAKTHPKFARAVGGFNNGTQSIYALAMGYNVISENSSKRANSGDYYCVIDRSALVIRG